MATTKAIFDLFTEIFDDLSVDELKQLTRPLRAAGLWPSGKGGRAGAGAAQVNYEHLAALALAVFTKMPPPKVLEAVQLYGNLRPGIAQQIEGHGDTTRWAAWGGKFSMLKGSIHKFMNEKAGQQTFTVPNPDYKFLFMPDKTILEVFAELIEAGRNPTLDLSRLKFTIDHTSSEIRLYILENHIEADWQQAQHMWYQSYWPLPAGESPMDVGEELATGKEYVYPGKDFADERARYPIPETLPITRKTAVSGRAFRLVGLVYE